MYRRELKKRLRREGEVRSVGKSERVKARREEKKL